MALSTLVVSVRTFRYSTKRTTVPFRRSVVIGRFPRPPLESHLSPSPFVFNGSVTILDRGEHHVVVDKPPGVVCHHSDWTGSRSINQRRGSAPEVPMLQRTREAVGERVNLVHRLDRGASGCLLCTFTRSDDDGLDATATLQRCMTSSTKNVPSSEVEPALSLLGANKTYIALVRGEGILRGRDLKKEGWFVVDRPIKDESGNLNNATTFFSFIAGQDNGNGTLDRPRASLVLARIKTGRWHQIRRHLNGISHPIIGDSSHGNSQTNREWRERWGLPPERTCLHLMKLELPPTSVTPSGISVVSTLAPDMMRMLEDHLPDLLADAERALKMEGLSLRSEKESLLIPISISVS
jgi:tRNA pseudouridine65 synthase